MAYSFSAGNPVQYKANELCQEYCVFFIKCSIFCVIKCSIKISIAINYVRHEVRPYLQRNNPYVRGARYSNSMCQSAGPLSREYNKLWF